jgi:hypothetical protein
MSNWHAIRFACLPAISPLVIVSLNQAMGRLPEGASLEEITEELQIMASIRRGRSYIAAACSKSHQEVEQLV